MKEFTGDDILDDLLLIPEPSEEVLAIIKKYTGRIPDLDYRGKDYSFEIERNEND